MNDQMTNDHLPILVVEDSDEDFDILSMTFESLNIRNPILRTATGTGAFALLDSCLRSESELPGIILLDLNLLGMDGREVLRRLKMNPVYRRIPVIILSTSSSSRDIDACYNFGAAGYTVKPVSLEKLEKLITNIKSFWLDSAVLPRVELIQGVDADA